MSTSPLYESPKRQSVSAFGGSLGNASGVGSSTPSSAAGSAIKLAHVPPVISLASTPLTQRDRVEVSIIKTLLESYLTIVKKNIADSVPKAVMHFMVNTLKDVIQSECVARLYKEDRFQDLLAEANGVQARRTKCRERLEALRKAMTVAEQVRERVDIW